MITFLHVQVRMKITCTGKYEDYISTCTGKYEDYISTCTGKYEDCISTCTGKNVIYLVIVMSTKS